VLSLNRPFDPAHRVAIERELRALVRHAVPEARVFFPRQRTRRHVRYSWNGRHLRPTGLTLESVCHEVAHLLVSSPARRHLPEFGIGPDPYRNSDAPLMIAPDEAAREEDAACTMQLVLARGLGLDEAAVIDEVRTPPLTEERVRELRADYEASLPRAWWQRVLELSRSPR
jgi:hypothetical protein